VACLNAGKLWMGGGAYSLNLGFNILKDRCGTRVLSHFFGVRFGVHRGKSGFILGLIQAKTSVIK
jgi:hypothetical protein